LYLQACRAAASDAANQAEHSKAAAESAAQAVLSCKKFVGDAAVSAEAQAQANKAGELQPHLTANAALQLGNDMKHTSGMCQILPSAIKAAAVHRSGLAA